MSALDSMRLWLSSETISCFSTLSHSSAFRSNLGVPTGKEFHESRKGSSVALGTEDADADAQTSSTFSVSSSSASKVGE